MYALIHVCTYLYTPRYLRFGWAYDIGYWAAVLTRVRWFTVSWSVGMGALTTVASDSLPTNWIESPSKRSTNGPEPIVTLRYYHVADRGYENPGKTSKSITNDFNWNENLNRYQKTKNNNKTKDVDENKPSLQMKTEFFLLKTNILEHGLNCTELAAMTSARTSSD